MDGSVMGIQTEFLVDTGSTYTIVDSIFYENIPENMKPPLEQINLILKNASGEVMDVLGQTNMDLEVKGQVFNVPVKVVSLGDKSTILGLDFMEGQNCILNLHKGTMKLNDRTFGMKRKGEIQLAYIHSETSFHIPPRHEMVIEGVLKDKQLTANLNEGLIESNTYLTNDTGLLVARSLVNLKQNTVPVRVANVSDQIVKIKKGTRLVKLESVKEVCNFDKGESKQNDEHIAYVNKIEHSKLGDLPEHLKPLVEKTSDSLSPTEHDEVTQLLYKYQDIFKSPEGRLGRTDLVKHRLDTGNAIPIKQRPRRLPMAQQDVVDKELDKMEAEGIIEPSDSPWSSPLVIVKKKTGDIRVCVDYRALNEVLRKSAVPLPKISECLDSLSGSKYFCTLDLAQGYYQVAMHPEDKCKTAFTSRRGLRQFTVMPFGLSNAPGTFQSLMELVLSGLQWSKAVLYLDDIITYGKTFEETKDNLECVFQRLRQAGLILKPSKCNLFQLSVEFLGHIVSSEGVSCDPKKLEAIREWPRPTSVKQVRSFLDLASYYRKFLKSFSTIASPLHALTKKNVKFAWDENCELAFQTLKEKLSSDPVVLSYPNNEGTFVLDTDASLCGIGGVLSQVQENGQEKVISFVSNTLSKTQQNYCTTMRELLAAVVFIKHFHHYLWGRKFILRTDHASLKWLVNFKEPEGMLARWLSVLCSYDFETQHHKGVAHVNADSLSRQPPCKCKRDDCEDCALVSTQCVCVVTRAQAKNQEGQGQVETQFDKVKEPDNSETKSKTKLNNDVQSSSLDDSELASNVMGKTLISSPTSIATSSENSEVNSQATVNRSTMKNKIKCNWADTWSNDQFFISAPMDKIACDIMGPLPETERKNIYILVVSDYYTKYVEAYALPDQTAQTVADCLVMEWICRFGVPLQILSDQGRNFESGLFQEVCKLLDMKKIRTSRYRPQTDGLVERYNRTLKSMLKSFCQVEKSDWDHHLPYVMMAYRATIQESTKCTPNLLMFGRETRLPVDIVYGATNTEMWPSCPIDYVEWVRQSMSNAFGKVKESVKANALRQKRAYDRNSAMRTFKVGEWVWVYHLPSDKQKFGQGWKGPFLVVDKIGDLNYRVNKLSRNKLSRKVTLHVDHIKRYEGETPESWVVPSLIHSDKETQTE